MGRALLVLIVLAASLAHAEWTAGAYLGAAHTRPDDLRIQQGTATDVRFRDVAWHGRSFQGPLYYGLRGGYFFTRGLGVEAEFIHLKIYADTGREVRAEGTIAGAQAPSSVRLDPVVEQFSISHGNNLLLANLVWRRGFQSAPGDSLAPFLITARAGAGGSIPHPESRIGGLSREHYQWGGPSFQLAGGGELRLWRGVYWAAEYKFTHNRQRVAIANGTARANFNTHHGVSGIALHF